MPFRKEYTGKISSNHRTVWTNEKGESLSQSSDITIDGVREFGISSGILVVEDKLLPVGTKIRLIFEEIE